MTDKILLSEKVVKDFFRFFEKVPRKAIMLFLLKQKTVISTHFWTLPWKYLII